MKVIIDDWTIILNSCGVVTLDNKQEVYYPVMKNGRILYEQSESIPKHVKNAVIQFFMNNLDAIY